MRMRAAIVTVALATLAVAAQDPAVADAATHAAAAAPEPGTEPAPELTPEMAAEYGITLEPAADAAPQA